MVKKMSYVYYNPNPKKRRTDDCVIRAISKFIDKDWYYVYVQLCIRGFVMGDWGSSNEVWSSYLRKLNYKRYFLPDTCPDCYTVRDFCIDYPVGRYLLTTGNHVICCEDGNYFDTWDSGDESIVFYWK